MSNTLRLELPRVIVIPLDSVFLLVALACKIYFTRATEYPAFYEL